MHAWRTTSGLRRTSARPIRCTNAVRADSGGRTPEGAGERPTSAHRRSRERMRQQAFLRGVHGHGRAAPLALRPLKRAVSAHSPLSCSSSSTSASVRAQPVKCAVARDQKFDARSCSCRDLVHPSVPSPSPGSLLPWAWLSLSLRPYLFLLSDLPFIRRNLQLLICSRGFIASTLESSL